MGARKLERYLTRQFEEEVSRASIEREQKYRVARVDAIRRRLLKLGAQVHASGFERNELYDCNERLGGQGLDTRPPSAFLSCSIFGSKRPTPNFAKSIDWMAARFALITSRTPVGSSKSKAHKGK